jgi:hypothetical protein
MNWPWKKVKKEEGPDTTGLEEAKKAAKQSEKDVKRVDSLIREVRPVMGQLHARREQNGFTEVFARVLKGQGET